MDVVSSIFSLRTSGSGQLMNFEEPKIFLIYL